MQAAIDALKGFAVLRQGDVHRLLQAASPLQAAASLPLFFDKHRTLWPRMRGEVGKT